MKKSLFIFSVLVINVLCIGALFSQTKDNRNLYDNPTQFRKYITDETGTLNASQISELNTKLQNEDKATTNQIIVYMISSLNGESLEEVSIKLAEKNKIGKKDRNNGILVLIVKDDKKIRLEVGYGLEGVMTDALSSKIIRKDITPDFKEGQYYEGINKGVDAIISSIKGEYTADKNDIDKNDNKGMNQTCCFGLPIFVIVIFGLIFFFIFISIIKSIASGHSVYTGKRGWNNSGWGGGSWGGGSGGSWGGGGGFSGGGGSFGGGGASGSW